ncbi:hypothetical protein [Fluviicola sp.]|uniref:hypothetical protein n=1 Tax=Fluviicola sp. TaxID=1917219 RepID=UPI0031E1D378
MTETKVYRDKQDRTSKEWQLLLDYIDKVAETGQEEFHPRRDLGLEVWERITVLPNEIGKLTDVKHLMLYNSHLERIPPVIANMRSLEVFTPYTSPRLRWFPYEITKCSNLKESTISTRKLYGNYKIKLPFPDLTQARVEFEGLKTTCGICEKVQQENELYEQYWVSLRVATDVVPLLISVCSEACFSLIPKGADGYIPEPHKGGRYK